MSKRSKERFAILKAAKLRTAGSGTQASGSVRVTVTRPRTAPSSGAFGGYMPMAMLDEREQALMDEPVDDIIQEAEWWKKWSLGSSGSGGASYTQSYGTKTVGKSYSSYWTSRFDDEYGDYGGGWGSSYGKKKSSVDFTGILGSVRRSANIVTNVEDGAEEKALVVQWAEGQPNTCSSNVVYVSPHVVDEEHTLQKKWSKDERTDVLVGEALAESAMKRTMDPVVEKLMATVTTTKEHAALMALAQKQIAKWKRARQKAIDDGDDPPDPPAPELPTAPVATATDRIRSGIWYTLERLAAERSVAKDYPGFKGYFATHRSYYTSPKAFANIQGDLSKKETAITAFSALQWELLHPEEHLDLPAATRDMVVAAMQRFTTAVTSEDRMNATVQVMEDILKRWPIEDEDDSRKQLDSRERLGMPDQGRGDAVQGDAATAADKNDGDTENKGLPGRGESLDNLVNWHDGTIDHKVSVRDEDRTDYVHHVQRLAPSIAALRSRLKIRNEEHRMMEHGLKRGRLDEGSLFKLGFSAAGYDDPNVFEVEEVRSVPKVAFGILIDESGSMSENERCEIARDIGIIVSNALMGVVGTQVAVLGHTAQYNGHDGRSAPGMILHHYFTPEHTGMEAMSRITALGNNLDGFAIGATALHMKRWFEDVPTKVLIVISDGYPCAEGYGGQPAMKHIGDVSMQCKADGVDVIGIGVDNAFDETSGNVMYGPGNYVLTDKVASATGIIANIITKVVRESAMRHEQSA